MAKKLLVRTPKTMDGITPMHDSDDRKLYSESLLPVTAMKHLENENSRRADGMKHKISIVEVDESGNIVRDKAGAGNNESKKAKKGTESPESETE